MRKPGCLIIIAVIYFFNLYENAGKGNNTFTMILTIGALLGVLFVIFLLEEDKVSDKEMPKRQVKPNSSKNNSGYSSRDYKHYQGYDSRYEDYGDPEDLRDTFYDD